MPRSTRSSLSPRQPAKGSRSTLPSTGVDWRSEEPVTLSIGPVLSLPDAVASKVSAVYSKAEVRDYLDLDAIRESGRFTDAEILDLAVDRDPGFDVQMFAGQLDRINRLGSAGRVEEYGVGEQELAQLKARLSGRAQELRNQAPTPGQRNIQKPQQSLWPLLRQCR